VSHFRRPIPKHGHHKAGGRGVVRLSGEDHYTGPWGTPEAEVEYERLLAEWLANGRSLSPPPAANPTPAGTGSLTRDQFARYSMAAIWYVFELEGRMHEAYGEQRDDQSESIRLAVLEFLQAGPDSNSDEYARAVIGGLRRLHAQVKVESGSGPRSGRE
jgi:hypothetical protein